MYIVMEYLMHFKYEFWNLLILMFQKSAFEEEQRERGRGMERGQFLQQPSPLNEWRGLCTLDDQVHQTTSTASSLLIHCNNIALLCSIKITHECKLLWLNGLERLMSRCHAVKQQDVQLTWGNGSQRF